MEVWKEEGFKDLPEMVDDGSRYEMKNKKFRNG